MHRDRDVYTMAVRDDLLSVRVECGVSLPVKQYVPRYLDRNAEATHHKRCTDIRTSDIMHQHPAVCLLKLPQPQEPLLLPPPESQGRIASYRHSCTALRYGMVRYILRLGNAGMATAVGTHGGEQGVGAGTWREPETRNWGRN